MPRRITAVRVTVSPGKQAVANVLATALRTKNIRTALRSPGSRFLSRADRARIARLTQRDLFALADIQRKIGPTGTAASIVTIGGIIF